MAYGRKSGSKFDYAATLTASLAYLMLNQTESVGLATFTDRIDSFLAPKAGSAQVARVIDVLERSASGGPSQLATALHDAGKRLERRSLVVVISDFLTPIDLFREGMAHLKHDRHEVICLRVLDRDEVEFPFRRWSRFRGMEGERPATVEPALARRTYLESFRRHRAALSDRCRALHVELHDFITDDAMGYALSRFLRGRQGA
jgi:uncharacterized protein (DUF58 family)